MPEFPITLSHQQRNILAPVAAQLAEAQREVNRLQGELSDMVRLIADRDDVTLSTRTWVIALADQPPEP